MLYNARSSHIFQPLLFAGIWAAASHSVWPQCRHAGCSCCKYVAAKLFYCSVSQQFYSTILVYYYRSQNATRVIYWEKCTICRTECKCMMK